MGPAIAIRVGRVAVGSVCQLCCLAVRIEPELHLDTGNIRDRAPYPIALDPICGSLLGHDRLPTSRDGLLRTICALSGHAVKN